MAMLLCPKCERMAFVRGDADPTKAVYCQHCGNKIERRVAQEKGMPDMLIDPETKSFADAEGAFEPPGAAPVARGSGAPEEKRPGPKLPDAKTKLADGEPWESAPIGAQPTAKGTAARKAGRRKRNPAMELVKMAVGGIVGLAIGYGILLWGFKVDPFNMAHYLPAVVVPDSVKTP